MTESTTTIRPSTIERLFDGTCCSLLSFGIAISLAPLAIDAWVVGIIIGAWTP